MSKTKIEWADITINPVIGCNKISDGCKNCYAHKMFPRLKGMGTRLYKDMKDFGDVSWDLDILRNGLKKIKKPQRIFLCSMSDLFHEKVPDEVIDDVLAIFNEYPQHIFMILTKRYERLFDTLSVIGGIKNVDFGVSICDNIDLERFLIQSNSWSQIFISFEPLLEKLDRNMLQHVMYSHCNYAIAGAETGNQRRPFEENWALDILKIARKNDIPFFFKKQFKDGEWTNKLDGKEYLEFQND
jgi:protein gp37